MSRRRRVLLWVGLLFVLAGTGLAWSWWATEPTERITLQHALKLGEVARQRSPQGEPVLTEAEVSAILGAPPGNYNHTGFTPPAGLLELHPGARKMWVGDRILVVVWFNAEGLMHTCNVSGVPMPGSAFDRLRRWLGL